MDFDLFKQSFNIALDAEQEAAVRQTEGAVLLLAVPGSGKTTTLVTRIGYMLHCCGVRPGEILTMTYTVAASRDMRERFASIFGNENAERLEFRTINGVCAKIIARYAALKGTEGFALMESNSQLLTEIYKAKVEDYPSEGDIKNLQQTITYIKNMRLKREELEELELNRAPVAPLYDEYIAEMKRRGRMDYDDQLVYAHAISSSRPEILAEFRARYKYICVDEAQDTSKIQHEIIRLLAGRSGNIFMVGDEDQSIYGFRAAYPDALMTFERDYDNATVLLLEKNYRSMGEIVSAAGRLIANNSFRHKKRMAATREAGAPVRQILIGDRARQYEYIAKTFGTACSGDTAILYRNNDSAIPLIDRLERAGAPFRCRKQESTFFSSRIVRDVRDILSLALSPRNAEAFIRVYSKFGLPIKRAAALEAIEECERESGLTLINALRETATLGKDNREKLDALARDFGKLKKDSAAAAMKRLRFDMGYGAHVLSHDLDTDRLFLLSAIAEKERDVESFIARLDELRAIMERGGSGAGLVLSTIHASKGLEYNRVVIMDAIDGILPSIILQPGGKAEDEEKTRLIEEERRLFYVAATRARNELVVLRYSGVYAKSTFTSQLMERPMPIRAAAREKPAEQSVFSGFPASEGEFFPGVRVVHAKFGRGEIEKLHNGIATVRFDSGRETMLALAMCVRMGLLRREGE